MGSQVQNQPKRLGAGLIILGVVAIVLLMAIPLFVVGDSQFGGSDNAGAEAITVIAPD